MQKTIISHGFKYKWYQSNEYNTNYFIDHLLCFVVIPFTWYFTIPLASNLIYIPKHTRSLMRGLWTSLCKRNRYRTSYHSNMERAPYLWKSSHKSTDYFLTVNQYLLQQSDWPYNWPAVHLSHAVFKIMIRLYCSVFLCCVKF